jgi:Kef-type K+ transport system membrane component KefB
MFRGSIIWKGIVYAILMAMAKAAVSVVVYCEYFMQEWKRKSRSASRQPGVDMAVHDIPNVQALMTASAMVARGEIGFLIASLSESSGTLTLQQGGISVKGSTGDDVFLVIVWAVVLCTIAGPVIVGILVKKLIKDIQPAQGRTSATAR